jgi:hypothetical protein
VETKAVENFLSTIDTTQPIAHHFMNCEADAKLYVWDRPTVVAIMKGIVDAYNRKFREDREAERLE